MRQPSSRGRYFRDMCVSFRLRIQSVSALQYTVAPRHEADDEIILNVSKRKDLLEWIGSRRAFESVDVAGSNVIEMLSDPRG